MALTSAAVLTSVALANPASAAVACGKAKTGHAGNTYQSCASSPAHKRFTATSIFKHDVGTVVFQLGTQTNGRVIVWGHKGSLKTKNGKIIVNSACKPGSKVRAALRVKYHSSWEPTAFSKVVTCA